MRKLVLSLALVALVAAPAMADLTPSAYSNPQAATNLEYTGGHTVGVYAPAGPSIYLSFKTSAVASDNLSATFAFHWPYSNPLYVIQAWSSLAWDNSEIAIVNTTAAGAFTAADNYPSATWWVGQCGQPQRWHAPGRRRPGDRHSAVVQPRRGAHRSERHPGWQAPDGRFGYLPVHAR